MAAATQQAPGTEHVKMEVGDAPGPSGSTSLQATVADEAEEAAAERGAVVTSGGAGAEGGENGDAKPDTDKMEVEENGAADEEEDGERITPCETLYIHNLNEKVRLPGEYKSLRGPHP